MTGKTGGRQAPRLGQRRQWLAAVSKLGWVTGDDRDSLIRIATSGGSGLQVERLPPMPGYVVEGLVSLGLLEIHIDYDLLTPISATLLMPEGHDE